MPKLLDKWNQLRLWLTEYEIYSGLDHPADSMVDPAVHNEVVRGLLEKLAIEREKVAGMERCFDSKNIGFIQ